MMLTCNSQSAAPITGNGKAYSEVPCCLPIGQMITAYGLLLTNLLLCIVEALTLIAEVQRLI